MLGVTQASVSRWQGRDRIPDILSIAAICRTFEVSSDWLLGVTPAAEEGAGAAPAARSTEEPGKVRRQILGMLERLEKGELKKSDREELVALDRRVAAIEKQLQRATG